MGDVVAIGLFILLLCLLLGICGPRSSPKNVTTQETTQQTSGSSSSHYSRPSSGYSSNPYYPSTYYYYTCDSSCRCVRRSSSSPRSNNCDPNNSLSCCTSSSCCNYSYCCSSHYCLPSLTFEINPNRLFVNQNYTLSWKVQSNPNCGSITCQGSCSYQGHNCVNGQVAENELGICPPSSNTQNICDPNNQFNKTLSSSGEITITANSDYWGLYQYSLSCKRSDNTSINQTQSVFVVPVLYYQEAQPFSKIFSPFLSLIENFKIR